MGVVIEREEDPGLSGWLCLELSEYYESQVEREIGGQLFCINQAVYI